jgi:hypothetical protein
MAGGSHDDFEPEFDALSGAIADELLAYAKLLAHFGATRPASCRYVEGLRHSNMKELRFDAAGGVWRVAFAFEPKRSCSSGRKRKPVERKTFLLAAHRESRRRFDAHLVVLKKREIHE